MDPNPIGGSIRRWDAPDADERRPTYRNVRLPTEDKGIDCTRSLTVGCVGPTSSPPPPPCHHVQPTFVRERERLTVPPLYINYMRPNKTQQN